MATPDPSMTTETSTPTEASMNTEPSTVAEPPSARAARRTRTRSHLPRRLRLKIWLRSRRYIIRQYPHVNAAYRTAVAVVSTVVILAGAAMVPLPTPGFGWLLIFAGLGLLSTEFTWAHRITTWLRRWLHILGSWYGRHSWPSRIAMILALAVLIVLVLWLAGILGTAGRWVGLDQQWLRGPFF